MDMSGTFRLSLLAITSTTLLSGLFACSSEELQGPEAEVSETTIKLDMPPVPEFVVPTANADGSHPVPELRLQGKSLLDTEIRLKGKVVWIYDCGTTIRTTDMSDADLAVMLHDHPEKCNPRHFIVAESGESPVERGVQVVEYPRPLREDELRNLEPEDIALKEAALAALPVFKVGDEVMVTGKWQLRSPKGFQNSDGLLTYGSMENLTAPAPPPEEPKKKRGRRR